MLCVLSYDRRRKLGSIIIISNANYITFNAMNIIRPIIFGNFFPTPQIHASCTPLKHALDVLHFNYNRLCFISPCIECGIHSQSSSHLQTCAHSFRGSAIHSSVSSSFIQRNSNSLIQIINISYSRFTSYHRPFTQANNNYRPSWYTFSK